MKEQIEILINLQKIESAASVLTADLDRVPQKLEVLDAKLKAYEKDIENESVQLDTPEKGVSRVRGRYSDESFPYKKKPG